MPALNAGRVPSVCFVFPLPLDLRSWAAGLQSVSSLFLFFFFFLPPSHPQALSQIREREGAAAVHVSNVCFCYFYFKPGPDLFPFSFFFVRSVQILPLEIASCDRREQEPREAQIVSDLSFFQNIFSSFFFAARSLGAAAAAAVAAAAARREVFTNS